MNVNKLAGRYENLKTNVRSHSYVTINGHGVRKREGCRLRLEFEDNVAELEIPCGKITIIGLDLRMKNFGFDSVKIYGTLHSIGFENIKGRKSEENK